MSADLFAVDAVTLATICAMAVATYAARAGGFFIIRRVNAGPFLQAWMRHVPGAIFVALVAPAVVSAGPAGWAGAAVTAAAARAGAPLAVTLALGVGTVAGLRAMMA